MKNGQLRALAEKHGEPLSLVHPRAYLDKVMSGKFLSDIRNHSLRAVLPALPGMIWNFALRRRKRSSDDA